MKLPYPIHFIYPHLDEWHDEFEVRELSLPDQLPGRFAAGHACWTVLTYLYLKHRGLDVRLVNRFMPHEICLAFYDDILIKQFPMCSFIVAIQPDRPQTHICEMCVVQNAMCIENPSRDHLMTLWSEPALMCRVPSRGNHVQRIGFIGRRSIFPNRSNPKHLTKRTAATKTARMPKTRL